MPVRGHLFSEGMSGEAGKGGSGISLDFREGSEFTGGPEVFRGPSFIFTYPQGGTYFLWPVQWFSPWSEL